MSDQDDHADFSDTVATFGDRIVAAREALGLTTAGLARRLGIKDATLQRWENDRAEPRANKLQMLAGILNVSMIWLMTGEGEGVPNEEAELPGGGRDLVLELRSIREESAALGIRMARLEKALRAHMRDA